jgi:hypothetical protein
MSYKRRNSYNKILFSRNFVLNAFVFITCILSGYLVVFITNKETQQFIESPTFKEKAITTGLKNTNDLTQIKERIKNDPKLMKMIKDNPEMVEKIKKRANINE